MSVHGAKGPTLSDGVVCEAKVITRATVTTELASITCHRCLLRLLVAVHQQQAIMLQTMMGLEGIAIDTVEVPPS